MNDLVAAPISTEAFAPFGTVVRAPGMAGRVRLPSALRNLRTDADASLTVARQLPGMLPLTSEVMERHRYSTQTFLPLDVERYVVVVAPTAGNGGPDMGVARAFVMPGDTGISYAADTWHHPLLVLQRPASFAVFMWRDGTPKDIETVRLDIPFTIRLA